MSMIRISSERYVAADQIAEVSIADYSNHVNVEMKNGTVHSHLPSHGQSVYMAMDKLLKAISDAEGDKA